MSNVELKSKSRNYIFQHVLLLMNNRTPCAKRTSQEIGFDISIFAYMHTENINKNIRGATEMFRDFGYSPRTNNSKNFSREVWKSVSQHMS